MKHNILCKLLIVVLSFSLVVTNLSIHAHAKEKISEVELPETEGYSYHLTEKTNWTGMEKY